MQKIKEKVFGLVEFELKKINERKKLFFSRSYYFQFKFMVKWSFVLFFGFIILLSIWEYISPIYPNDASSLGEFAAIVLLVISLPIFFIAINVKID